MKIRRSQSLIVTNDPDAETSLIRIMYLCDCIWTTFPRGYSITLRQWFRSNVIHSVLSSMHWLTHTVICISDRSKKMWWSSYLFLKVILLHSGGWCLSLRKLMHPCLKSNSAVNLLGSLFYERFWNFYGGFLEEMGQGESPVFIAALCLKLWILVHFRNDRNFSIRLDIAFSGISLGCLALMLLRWSIQATIRNKKILLEKLIKAILLCMRWSLFHRLDQTLIYAM